MFPIEIFHGDIADADVDVLVNASNTLLRLGSGVSGAIRRACGAGYQEDLTEILAQTSPAGLQPGDVVLTHAGAHPRAKRVAHVAVMDYRERDDVVPRPDLARIERGARLLWQALADLEQPVSVGMVALGAGTGGIGLRSSVEVACRTLKSQLERRRGGLGRVVFVSYDVMEHVNTAAVVSQHFDVDLGVMTDEARRMMELLGAD